MSKIYKTLRNPSNDTELLYPNIDPEHNIPNGSIDSSKLKVEYQKKLTAGNNITINEEGVISASGGESTQLYCHSVHIYKIISQTSQIALSLDIINRSNIAFSVNSLRDYLGVYTDNSKIKTATGFFDYDSNRYIIMGVYHSSTNSIRVVGIKLTNGSIYEFTANIANADIFKDVLISL